MIEQQIYEELRELFIKRMTIDSETTDRRRKDFNQAIFTWDDYSNEYTQVFCGTNMEMVLECFDNAVKDFKKNHTIRRMTNDL